MMSGGCAPFRRRTTTRSRTQQRAARLTRGEIKGCLAVGAGLETDADLPDPIRWADLASQPDVVVRTVDARRVAGAGPRDATVFEWPKNRYGFRPMAVLDPFDQVTYRALVGRLVLPLAAAVDSSVVLSSRIARRPPRWCTEDYRKAAGERRKRGMRLLLEEGSLATLDIENYYPSIRRHALETLRRNGVHDARFDQVLGWLDQLHASSAVTGLPIGPGGSEILGNALLAPGDHALAALGLSFLRYMDDSWVFLPDTRLFDEMLAAYRSAVEDSELALTCHPEKCALLDFITAEETIRSSAVQYAHAMRQDPDTTDDEVGLDLFVYGMQDPDVRVNEVRAALAMVGTKHAEQVLQPLFDDPSLIALAPAQWRRLLQLVLADKKARRRTRAGDWLLDRVTATSPAVPAYEQAVLLQAAVAAASFKPSKTFAQPLLETAVRAQGVAEPVQAGAAHLWSRCDGYKPHHAVGATEAAPSLLSKRGFAVTLHARAGDKKMPTWVEGIRRADLDLEATAKWLLAA